MTDEPEAQTTPTNMVSLRARLRNAAKDANLPEVRLQRQRGVLVVAEMLGRIRGPANEHLFLIKGGSNIEMRLGASPLVHVKSLRRIYPVASVLVTTMWVVTSQSE